MVPSFLTLLYDIVVTPLVYIVDLAFSLLLRQLGDPGIALIGVSLTVNFLCLPLYRMADRLQEEERVRQARMAVRVAQIKRTFKGDEQYMMLSTYYRQQGYRPFYALRSTVSLLLQIPIFMAAYNYLSQSQVLQGVPFLFLADLGAPDGLIALESGTLNLMPILMTLLNAASTLIYTRGLGLRDKLQAYGLAIVFLVLLYDSPSGLVFYWTCNQLFSLVKNVFLKLLHDPDRVFGILVQVAIVWVAGFLVGSGAIVTLESALLLVAVIALIDVPLISRLVGREPRWSVHPAGLGSVRAPFLSAATVLALLLGLLIPSALLGASPQEFSTASGFDDCVQFLVHTACVQTGLFVLWVGTYFYLSEDAGKHSMAFGVGCLALVALVDHFFFAQDLGIISAALVFEKDPVFDIGQVFANLAAILGVVTVFALAWKRLHFAVTPLLIIMAGGVIALSIPNIQAVVTKEPLTGGAEVVSSETLARRGADGKDAAARRTDGATDGDAVVMGTDPATSPEALGFEATGSEAALQAAGSPVGEAAATSADADSSSAAAGEAPAEDLLAEGAYAEPGAPELHQATVEVPFDEDGTPLPILNLSRKGRNVVVVFLDRAVGSLVPYIFNAQPRLYDSFDGFTYYPNTISYGLKTVFGSPALYGGYEYSAEQMNYRYDLPLVTKHNEALRLMPMLFSDAGFETIVFDPPLVNYGFSSSDFSLYDDIPGVSVYHTSGAYLRYFVQNKMLNSEGGLGYDYGEVLAENARKLRRNLCYYGLFRAAPTFVKTMVYDGGDYLAVSDDMIQRENPVAEWCEVVARRIGLPVATEPEAGAGEAALVGLSSASAAVSEETASEIAAMRDAEAKKQAAAESATNGYVGKLDFNTTLCNWYSVLALMPELTQVADDASDHFLLLQNSTTHEPYYLQMPDFVPALYVDNEPYWDPTAIQVDGRQLAIETSWQLRHYMVNAAALLRLGEWFDSLRAAGCWDNTRVIVVSDHGEQLDLLPELMVADGFDAEGVNALLMIKDFGAKGFTMSTDFMTNADVPVQALRDIVADPINPSTGNPVTDADKQDHPQLISTSLHWDATTYQQGTTYDTSDGRWYTVHDDIYDLNNWQLVE